MIKIISYDWAQTWSCDRPVARTSDLCMRISKVRTLDELAKN
jgi:hypothetical protein